MVGLSTRAVAALSHLTTLTDRRIAVVTLTSSTLHCCASSRRCLSTSCLRPSESAGPSTATSATSSAEPSPLGPPPSSVTPKKSTNGAPSSQETEESDKEASSASAPEKKAAKGALKKKTRKEAMLEKKAERKARKKEKLDEVKRARQRRADAKQEEPSGAAVDKWKSAMESTNHVASQGSLAESESQKDVRNEAGQVMPSLSWLRRLFLSAPPAAQHEEKETDEVSRRLEEESEGASSRERRMIANAANTNQGRSAQTDSGQESKFNKPIVPVGPGVGVYPTKIGFEYTEMVYPPRDVYPPPIPQLRDADLVTAGRSLGVLRNCDVQWIEGKRSNETGQWRLAAHGVEWYASHYQTDRMDSAQNLEYIGDSFLSLLCRTSLIKRFPRRSMLFYTNCTAFLVSNDVFGHVYMDAGLEKERIEIAKILQIQSKNAELQRLRPTLTPEQYKERNEAPLPEPFLPPLHHLGQADLLEAYVGSVYLVLGFDEASKWCTRLLGPWLDRLERAPGFNIPHTMTIDGEGYLRIEKAVRAKIEQERLAGIGQEEERSTITNTWMQSLQAFFGRRKGSEM